MIYTRSNWTLLRCIDFHYLSFIFLTKSSNFHCQLSVSWVDKVNVVNYILRSLQRCSRLFCKIITCFRPFSCSLSGQMLGLSVEDLIWILPFILPCPWNVYLVKNDLFDSSLPLSDLPWCLILCYAFLCIAGLWSFKKNSLQKMCIKLHNMNEVTCISNGQCCQNTVDVSILSRFCSLFLK